MSPFFSLSRRKIRSFLPSLGVFSWNFGVFFEAPGPSNVHVWRARTCTFEGPFKHHQNSTRERRKNENCGRRGKKRAKFWVVQRRAVRRRAVWWRGRTKENKEKKKRKKKRKVKKQNKKEEQKRNTAENVVLPPSPPPPPQTPFFSSLSGGLKMTPEKKQTHSLGGLWLRPVATIPREDPPRERTSEKKNREIMAPSPHPLAPSPFGPLTLGPPPFGFPTLRAYHFFWVEALLSGPPCVSFSGVPGCSWPMWWIRSKTGRSRHSKLAEVNIGRIRVRPQPLGDPCER